MPDYSKGKIYKLWSPELPEDMIYIGSTVNELYKRFYQHKAPTNSSISSYIFLNSNDVKIELIENYPCADKNELIRREGEWIRKLKCINKVVAGRTKEEWREQNKELLVQKAKEYYEENKDKIKEQTKEYYNQNKNKIKEQTKEYREKNKDKRKEYLENNKDKIKDKTKEYREKNKDKTKEYNKQYWHENKEWLIAKKREKRLEKKLSKASPRIHA